MFVKYKILNYNKWAKVEEKYINHLSIEKRLSQYEKLIIAFLPSISTAAILHPNKS
jgi:hypothetical protein